MIPLMAISFIPKVLKFIKEKWEIILTVILVVCFSIYILKLRTDIRQHQDSIVELQEQVIELEVSNQTLIKNYAFYIEQIRILEAYSNSGKMLFKISNYQLPIDQRQVLIEIEREYTSLFPRLRLTNVLAIQDIRKEIEELREQEELETRIDNFTNIENVETITNLGGTNAKTN